MKRNSSSCTEFHTLVFVYRIPDGLCRTFCQPFQFIVFPCISKRRESIFRAFRFSFFSRFSSSVSVCAAHSNASLSTFISAFCAKQNSALPLCLALPEFDGKKSPGPRCCQSLCAITYPSLVSVITLSLSSASSVLVSDTKTQNDLYFPRPTLPLSW